MKLETHSSIQNPLASFGFIFAPLREHATYMSLEC